MSQPVPVTTTSPFTCFVFTTAVPAGTVSFVWVVCAATTVARLSAAAPRTKTRQAREAVRIMLSSSFRLAAVVTRRRWGGSAAVASTEGDG